MTDTTTRDLTVTRVFNAPVERVWKAFTDADDVRDWWGPTGFTSPLASMDIREGGTSLVCMRSPEGHELYNTWTYMKIVPNEWLEYDLRFSDEQGNPLDPAAIGLPPGIPSAVPHEVIFRDIGGGKTEVTVTERGYTSDQVVEISKAGLEQCLDKMEASFGNA